MFEAGALIWRIQTVGKDVLRQDLAEAERAAGSAGRALGETGEKVEGLGKKSQQSGPQVRGVANEIKNMSDRGQQASREIGGTLAAVGAAVTGMAVLAVKAAKDWETAWTGVMKTVDATPEELAQIETGLRDLTKILPATHTEIAAVAEAAGQLGVKAKDIVAFTRTMVDLGETTNLTADEAATSLAQFMNIMQTAPEDVHRLGSAVVALGNNGASTERDIVQMSQRIAGAGKIIGLTEGETLGLANALASVGIEADAGGSSISAVMIDIATAVSEKGDKLLKWAELAGLSAEEFAEKYRTKPAEAIALVVEGLGRLNKSGGDVFSTLSDLGQTDIRVTRSLLSLANSGDLLRNSLELGNQAWEDDIALQAEAEKRYETTAAKLDIAKNAVVDMAISLGTHLLPIVEAGAKGISDFASMVGGLPDGVQSALIVLTAIAGGITLVAGAAFLAVPRVVLFRQSLRQLAEEMPLTTARVAGFASFLGGPWGIAIAAAIGAITLLYEREQAIGRLATEYTATLDEQTGAITRNTRQKLAQKLSEEGVFESAKKAGISQYLLTDAILGNEDALQRVNEKLQAFNFESGTTDRILNPLGRDTLSMVSGALDANMRALDGAKTGWEDTNSAMRETPAAAGDATDAYVEQHDAVQDLASELDQLMKIIDESNETNRDAITSSLDYKDALREIDNYVRQAREGVEGFALGLDTNTEAGSANMAMLVDLSAKASEAAEAQLALDGNVEAFQGSLEASRDALIQRAIDLGYNRDQAVALADSILRIPPKVETQALVNTTKAQQALADLRASLAAFQSSNYGVNVSGYIKSSERALGGIDFVRHMAMGGVGSNAGVPAQVRRAGDVTVWAEQETGGESYIPWANDHRRPRAVAILERTADEFGFELVPRGVQRFAEGAATPVTRTPTAPVSFGSAPTDLSDRTIQKLARALAPLMRNRNRDGGPTNG